MKRPRNATECLVEAWRERGLCVCCGLPADKTLPCGCGFCSVCLDRLHHRTHRACGHNTDPENRRRMTWQLRERYEITAAEAK